MFYNSVFMFGKLKDSCLVLLSTERLFCLMENVGPILTPHFFVMNSKETQNSPFENFMPISPLEPTVGPFSAVM